MPEDTDPTTDLLPGVIAPAVAHLAAEGLGRNEIARRMKVARGTVTSAAKLAGVTFDRQATAAATAARVTDLRTRRQELSARFLTVSSAVLDAVDPDDPDARAVRERITAAAVAVDKHLRIDAHDAEGRDLSAVDSFHAAMLGGKADDDDVTTGVTGTLLPQEITAE